MSDDAYPPAPPPPPDTPGGEDPNGGPVGPGPDSNPTERPALSELVSMKDVVKNTAVRGYMKTLCSFLGAKTATQEETEEQRKLALARKFASKWMHKTFVHRKGARVRRIAEMTYDKRWRSRAFFRLKTKRRDECGGGGGENGGDEVEMTGVVAPGSVNVDVDAQGGGGAMAPNSSSSSSSSSLPGPSSSGQRNNNNNNARSSQRAPLVKSKPKVIAADIEFEEWEEDDPSDLSYTPWFIWGMCVLHIMVFVLEVWNNNWSLEPMGVNPFLGVSSVTLFDFGAKHRDAIVDDGQGWRLFAAIFAHSGVVHLVITLAFSLRTGAGLERLYGWRIPFIYFLSSVSGYLGSCLFLPDDLSVGSGPALMGLCACLLVEVLQNWGRMESPFFALAEVLFLLVAWLVISLLLPGLDNFAHLVSFVIGIPLSGIFLPTVMFGPRFDVKRKLAVIFVCLVPIVSYFVVVVPLVYAKKDLGSACSFCRHINCVAIKDGWCEQPTL